jgi:hypothetical protein
MNARLLPAAKSRQRKAAVRFARASTGLEGLQPSKKSDAGATIYRGEDRPSRIFWKVADSSARLILSR